MYLILCQGVPDKFVSNETELREAISSAPAKTSFTITLNNDITLTDSPLTISANKNIILTSNKATGYYKLVGTAYGTAQFMVGEVSLSTITVNGGGVLELNGVEVTHACNYLGYVVTVSEKSQFILHRGLISSEIGGVSNAGVFLMHDGEISSNIAINGGGVFNTGVFRMFGGKISGNSAGNNGGGVYNEAGGTFEMSSGEISGNKATNAGGGVINYGGVTFIEYEFTSDRKREIAGYNQREGSFTLTDGVISGNTAGRGGGVCNCGIFTMSGGVISDNIATGSAGGGVDNGGHSSLIAANFEMSKGEISGNTAEKGGGVYNGFNSIAILKYSGVISDNTAKWGGGVCSDSNFTMNGGAISGNTAKTGGGMYIGNGIFKLTSGKISDNTAPISKDVHIENGVFEQANDKISDNRDNMIICVCIVTVAIVITGLFFYFRKRAKRASTENTQAKVVPVDDC